MRLTHLRAPALLALLVACGSGDDDPNGGRSSGSDDPSQDPAGQVPTAEEQVKKILDQRKTDYGEALRTASLKLRDRLPDLAEIKQVDGPDENAKKVAYEKLIDEMLDGPEFGGVMVKFWKDTFRTGQVGQVQENVNKDAAANFAAQITIENRAYTDLFTATENTCPTFDGAANTFTAANCQVPQDGQPGPTVGVLTDPGLMGQYFANMAFRRVRFVQETFVCTKFPAEYGAEPKPMGNGVYTAAIPFTTITGLENTPAARVDFQDTKAVVCANCHANMNHVAPLFLNYAENGGLRNTVQVKVPIMGEPAATRDDYLPPGEGLLWRLDKPLTDMASLGKALAEDPDVAKCAVNRMWNFAMSRGDIVNDLATVPDQVTAPYVEQFKASGMKLKETIRAVFKSEDFTKF
ncbi:MAG: DUF1549 domain-containing protein [Labilithrix sp.]|nr:DUF1549 domain-containing protein [Labilithrix sp.]MCW5815479.1 DUF1549 domain-containing protein [Labilithrix sp.]